MWNRIWNKFWNVIWNAIWNVIWNVYILKCNLECNVDCNLECNLEWNLECNLPEPGRASWNGSIGGYAMFRSPEEPHRQLWLDDMPSSGARKSVLEWVNWGICHLPEPGRASWNGSIRGYAILRVLEEPHGPGAREELNYISLYNIWNVIWNISFDL